MVRGNSSSGLTARGRVMQSPMDQLVVHKLPNKFYNIRLTHVSGPMKGIHMEFKCALARKARVQNVCLCPAYSYPHNKGKGACNG